MSKTFVLLLLLGTALAATQVNISIAQNPAPAGVTYIDGKAPAELRAGPAERRNHPVENTQARPAQLRATDKAANFEHEDSHTGLNSGAQDAGYSFEERSARLQAAGDLAHIQQLQQQGFSDRVTYSHSGNSNARPQQLQQRDEQDKQNQEFERYIKNYHSGGPTVETVFESANPAAQHYQQPSSATSAAYSSASSAGGAPARIVAIRPQSKQLRTFERQVALPAASPLSAADGVANHPTKSSDSIDGQQVSSLPSSSGTSYSSVAAPNNIPYSTSPTQTQAAVGYDQPDYGQHPAYNKPDFEQPLFNYDAAPQPDLYNQYPAPVDPAQAAGYDGYGGNFDQGNFYGGSVAGGYHPAQPPYQRRVITKTIQIAQPALKAKKYEVRHPAIQREFYDIEERVVIKPAGTIVVELERPVAKIAKGETILPLGHPHPAVASAYNQPSSNGFGSLSSSSGYVTSNNQYNSGFLQSQKSQNVLRPNTVASTITADPTYDLNSKDAFVEHNLNRQYGGGSDEPQFVANPERSYNEAKSNNQDFLIINNAQGNQRKISSQNNVVSKDESDLSYPVQVPQAEVKYNGAQTPTPTTYVSSPQNYGAGEPQFTANTEPSYNEAKTNDQDFLIITDAQGNQRKISSKNITPNMLSKDESDLSYPVQVPQVEVKYNGAQTPAPAPAPTTYARSPQNYGAGEPQFTANTERSYNEAKPNNQDFLIITDVQGNQRKISSKNITPNMLSKDESDISYPVQVPQVEVKYNGAPAPAPTTYAVSSQSFPNYNNKNSNNVEQAAAEPNNRRFQANFNDNNQYQGEYLPAELYNNANNQQDFKPARLQQAPVRSESKSSTPAAKEPAITYEHNIHLPGMQHNIYLQRSEQSPQAPLRRAHHSRYEDEVARVLEIKPHLRHQPQRYEPQRYTQSGREQPGVHQYRAQLRNDAEDANRVQYSAPYSHMRYLPEESGQLKSAASYADELPVQARNQKLILPQKNQDNRNNEEALSSGKSALRPLTHIQIQFPQQPQEAAGHNVVSSTITPSQEQQQRANYDADKLDSASDLRRGDQEYARKPDCDQPTQFSARYENVPLYNNPQQSRGPQKFQRIIQASNVSADAAVPSSANVVSIAPDTVDNGVKSTSGHIPTGGSRVIAATAASTDSSAANESFHKRRIVVNHPFQTVREVVEHEPITNYHQVQVNEPALPAGPYDQAPYFETHDAPRQAHADSTHSHLRYSAPAQYSAAFRKNHRA